MRAALVFVPLLAVALAGCSPRRPPRFFDGPVVDAVADDAPSDVPRATPSIQAVYLSEVYVHRSLVVALDPLRVPVAGDVNALDEVPRSSWFDDEPASRAVAADLADGAPVLPLTVLPEPLHDELSLAATDARGLRYELRFDPKDRPEMRTGAAMIASRLARDLGYLVPPTELVTVRRSDLHAPPGAEVDAMLATSAPPGPNGYRAVAVRWPLGLDLGPTPPSTSRLDDPNDRVEHRDRRTLRGLRAVGAWLGLTHFDTRTLRDAYVGRPGLGHVRHYLVGLEGALGARDVVRPGDQTTERAAPSPLVRLLSLGLCGQRTLVPTQTEHPAVGDYSPEVQLRDFSPDLPFDPILRAQAPDSYWAAKRIAKLATVEIEAAVDTARFGDPTARGMLLARIEARRATVVAQALAAVSPLEVARVDAHTLHLRDEAVRLGVAASGASRYEISLVDPTGHPIGGAQTLVGEGADVAVRLPDDARVHPYVVVRATVVRGGRRAPRAAEVHVALAPEPHVIGVRH